MTSRGLHLVQKGHGRDFVGNCHARAAEISQRAEALDRIADYLDTPGQIYEVEPQLLKRRIVNGG